MRASLLALLPLALLAAVPAEAQPEAAADAGPVPVHVGFYLISFGDHDVNKGTYTMDFYLVFRWDAAAAPAGFTPERFEFMNGRAASQDLLSDEEVDGVREQWHRVQAKLYSEPRFRNHPYDRQHLDVLLEDAVHGRADLLYVPDEGLSDVDPTVRVSGWRIDSWSFEAGEHEYGFEETYSRAVFRLVVSREPLSITLRSFLPPFTFALLAGMAFVLHPSKVDNRISLATGMLVAAVAFHISQTVSLPSLGRLSLFDQAMIATYAFIAGSLAASILISVERNRNPESAHVARINRLGAAATFAAALAVFLALRLV